MTTTNEMNLGSLLALEISDDHNHFVAIGEDIYLVLPDRVVALHDREELTGALREYDYLDPEEEMTDDFYHGFRVDASEVCEHIEDLVHERAQLHKARQSDDDAKDVLRKLFNAECD
jgi:hypothetical protein